MKMIIYQKIRKNPSKIFHYLNDKGLFWHCSYFLFLFLKYKKKMNKMYHKTLSFFKIVCQDFQAFGSNYLYFLQKRQKNKQVIAVPTSISKWCFTNLYRNRSIKTTLVPKKMQVNNIIIIIKINDKSNFFCGLITFLWKIYLTQYQTHKTKSGIRVRRIN